MSEHIYFAESGLPKLRPDYAAARTINVVQRLVLPPNHPTAVKE